MITKNVFLQGIYPFEGAGMDKPVPLHAELAHVVPDGVISQARYVPIGAKGDVHVPLRVVEDIDGGSVIELHLVAPTGLQGTVVVDLGTVEH